LEETIERIARLEQEREELLDRFDTEKGELAGSQEQALAEAHRSIEELRTQVEEHARRSEAERGKRKAEFSDLEAHHESVVSRMEQDRAEVEAQVRALEIEGAKAEQAISRLEKEREDLQKRFETEKGELAGSQEKALATTQRQLEKLEAERAEIRQEMDGAVTETRKKDRALRRLQVRQTQLRESLTSRETEVTKLSAELESATSELEKTRQEIETVRESVENSAVTEIRRGLEELKSSVSENGTSRGLDQENLDALLTRLGERDQVLEDRVGDRMSETIAEISRTIRSATASPIENCEEATDVLVGRIFDSEADMKTNLESISVEELRGGEQISDHLARLKALRGPKPAVKES
jgi:chromosome segregation ATPase